jgi:lipopolysaccharide/colanic/teichoic acid biosynthesis glycosyltransferase
MIDIVCCLAAMPILALCTLLMTIITKFVSPGPIFFRQERIGHLGRRFKIYKFRTMVVGADTSVHQSYCKDLISSNAPMVKMDARGDARLIPGGWLLRASGLDELPQLINVLRGEMSLVGPRPCIPSEFDQYLPWQRRRCDAMPGLTGLWQVSGKNRTTFEQMIRYDIHYAQNISFGQDLKIILMTVPALLVQIYDTRIGRRSTAISQYTAVPFSISHNEQVQVNHR